MADTNQRQYGDGTNSDIGTQFNQFLYKKKALIEALRESYFGQLSNSESMPKHYGKTMKKYHYVPLLHDANTNDQGIDATGLSTNQTVTLAIGMSDGSIPSIEGASEPIGGLVRFVGSGVDANAAAANLITKVIDWATKPVIAGGLGLTLTGVTDAAKFDEIVNSTNGLAFDKGYRFTDINGTAVNASTALAPTSVPSYGNLWGSSRDVGTINNKLPALSETGGYVNRVGFTRLEIQASISKFGIYDEYTKDSYDFDTDAQLDMHVNRELVRGANYIYEDLIQMDLLNQAGIVRFGGVATATTEITGEGANKSIITYDDLLRLNIDLDNNRCPKDTVIIKGSRLTDTRTINSARIMYVGSEVVPMLKRMQDPFGNQAFISVEKYASAGDVLKGEIGCIDQFRIVVVPHMMFWEAAGAAVGSNEGYRETNGNYDVYPLLVVGSGAFSTIGFQTSGDNFKFKIKHIKPESPESYARDPYGETGLTSIKFFYGTLIERPEWIALFKTVAEW